MKRVVAAIGTVFGFFGIAGFVLFFIMTPNANYAPPRAGLTANIADAVSSDVAITPTPDQPANADTGAGSILAASTDSASSPQASSPRQNSGQAGQTAPMDSTKALQAAAAPATEPTSAATPLPAPAPIVTGNASGSLTDIPEATATITVTPTAPLPPPPRAQSPTSSWNGGISLPYSESNFDDNGAWQTVWGTTSVTQQGAMDLSAGAASHGGAVYLKNAARWTNDTMSATLDWVGGATIGLMANYADASNYVECEYQKTGPDTVAMQLLQYSGGGRIALTPAIPIASKDGGSDLNLSITVSGVYGTCSWKGITVSSEGIGPGKSAMASPGTGSVGFVIGDPTPATARILVKHVSVAER